MKTPSKTPNRKGKNGGKLLTGNPGNKGGTGRPPNWLRDWCDELLASPEAKKSVEAVVKNPKHPAFSTMWKAIADRAHGRPKETVDINTKETVYIVEAPAKFTTRETWQQQYSQN